MSLETSLTSIAKSLEIIATYLSTTKNVQTTTIETTHAATPVPAAPVPAVTVSAPSSAPDLVVPVAAPVVAVPVAPAPVAAMPAAPVFTDAVPTPPVTAVSAAATIATVSPFKDKQAMMDFVIASYRELGPEKGARIQGVLESIGYKNINDVVESQWGQLRDGINALKG